MRSVFLFGFLIGLAANNAALARQKEVLYGPLPKWVLPPPVATETAAPDGAVLKVIYADTQINLGTGGNETFTSYRVKLIKPESLSIGNISVTWNPDAGDTIIHFVRIIRDNHVINILPNNKFKTIQRESNLESAVLDGQLTATLQAPGLQIGDEFEFATTIRNREQIFSTHSFGFGQLPVTGAVGAYRFRTIWPKDRNLHWKTTADLNGSTVQNSDGQTELNIELRDPKSSIFTTGAPARFNLRRLLEYSDFSSWNEVSKQLLPFFDTASKMAPTSLIHSEVSKIVAATSSPEQRALLALQLVEGHTRYVFVGLDGGNYLPATADETWQRRFGDCKAKTVLLIAILRELGIQSEPVLVNITGGDGFNERLPTPSVFNHVLVRATINGKPYWLDATRLGDVSLNGLNPLPFSWALPLRADAADLEKIEAQPATQPQIITTLDIDARSGSLQKNPLKIRYIMRGAEAEQIGASLSAMGKEDAERAVQAYWRENESWIETETVSWRYDADQKLVVLSAQGNGDIDSDEQEAGSQDFYMPSSGFFKPDQFRRPKEQDQSIPWATNFPTYKCWVTTIKLPDFPKRIWEYSAAPINQKIGGIAYWRKTELENNIIRNILSRKTYLSELTEKQANELNESLKLFNNNKANVFQILPRNHGSENSKVSSLTEIDWEKSDSDCQAPSDKK